MTVQVAAAYGLPPADIAGSVKPLILNQTRFSTTTECSMRSNYTFNLNRVPARVGTALNVGSLTHSVYEDRANGVPRETILRDAEGWRGDDKDLNRFIDDLPHILDVWDSRYGSETLTYLGVEQPWWLLLTHEDGPTDYLEPILILGRTDAVIETGDGDILNYELKTASIQTDTAAFLSWRRNHPQQVTTDLALSTIHGPQYRGTRYEFLFKHARPLRGTSTQTLEERLAEWPDKLFYRWHEPVTLSAHSPSETYWLWREIATRLYVYMPRRNHTACMTFGRASCPYFDVCHNGESLSSSNFADREPDYVDEAMAALQTPEAAR